MFLVAIGSCSDADVIKDDIYRRFEEAKKDGTDIVYEDYYIGNALFIRCGIKDKFINRITDRRTYEEFRLILSKILTEIIIKHYEMKLLRKIVRDNFFYLSDTEQDAVISTALKLIKDENQMQPGSFGTADRRSRIMQSILLYLDTENEFNIEGFINFRLNAYINLLNETMERALEIYAAEREYNEFINLLRYFVEIQECKIDTVHLCQSKEGKYLLYDENRNSINSEYYDELRSDIADESINYDDLLISTLITISPNSIIIYDIEDFKNRELIQTIMNVFTERITICSRCKPTDGKAENRESNKFSL